MKKSINALHRFFFFLCVSLFFCLTNTESINAQDYARYYGIWDKYLGMWYGKNNTVVRLFHDRDGGNEMMINIRYNGVVYDDALYCTSSSFAMADCLTRKDTGKDADLSAGLFLSSGVITLKLYPKDSQNAFYESKLSRKSATSTTRKVK